MTSSRPSGRKLWPEQNRLTPPPPASVGEFFVCTLCPVAGSHRYVLLVCSFKEAKFMSPTTDRRPQYKTFPVGRRCAWIATFFRLNGGSHLPATLGEAAAALATKVCGAEYVTVAL